MRVAASPGNRADAVRPDAWCPSLPSPARMNLPAKVRRNISRQWASEHERWRIDASDVLMIDTLVDLTHLGSLHIETVGSDPARRVDAETSTTRTFAALRYGHLAEKRRRPRCHPGGPCLSLA